MQFHTGVRKGLSGKDSCEHTPEGRKPVGHEGPWGERPRPREPQAEVGGESVPSTPEGQQGAHVRGAEQGRGPGGRGGQGRALALP